MGLGRCQELQYRLPDGQTVVDRFVASRPDLEAADREMLLSWRDPVEGSSRSAVRTATRSSC
jgi:hypothetical protein